MESLPSLLFLLKAKTWLGLVLRQTNCAKMGLQKHKHSVCTLNNHNLILVCLFVKAAHHTIAKPLPNMKSTHHLSNMQKSHHLLIQIFQSFILIRVTEPGSVYGTSEG